MTGAGKNRCASKRLGSPYRSGWCKDWLKFKNPAALAVKREADEDWGGDKGARKPCGRLELWSQCAFSARRAIHTDSTSPPMMASPLFLLLMHREPTLRQPQHI
jgi:hypothetical protein